VSSFLYQGSWLFIRLSGKSDGNTHCSYVKNLEDRVAHLERVLLSHGITDYENPSTSPPVADTPRQVPTASATGIATMASAGVPQLLVAPLTHVAAVGTHPQGPPGTHSLLDELTYEARAAMPSKDASEVLTTAYFEHTEFFSPILDRQKFLDMLDDPTEHSPQDNYRTMVVFAVAGCLLNRKDPSFPISRSEVYYATALRLLADNPSLSQGSSIEHLCNFTLAIQYSMFQQSLTAAWYLLGHATRMAIELELHLAGDNTNAMSSTADERQWIFWAVYSFERILCNVLNRPVGLPDEAITTPLPEVNEEDSHRSAAIHIIKQRQLLSEIHSKQLYNHQWNNSAPDHRSWQLGMRQRLHSWYTSSPELKAGSKLIPENFWDGTLTNTLVLLLFPWPHLQSVDAEDIPFLAERASHAIDVYKTSFREGSLRYYWRTLHHLYRAGAALVYCIKQISMCDTGEVSLTDLRAAVNTCCVVLWGMVERHHSGHTYRDMFDSLSSTLDQAKAHVPWSPSLPFGDFQDFAPDAFDFGQLE
jgi:hypothetical protein